MVAERLSGMADRGRVDVEQRSPRPLSWFAATALLLLAAVLSTIVPGAPAASASDNVNQAVQAYNSGQYLQAVQSCLASIRQNFDNATAHYYLASSLAQLNQPGEALNEYKIAYCLCPPHSQMASFCRLAIDTYQNKQINKQAVSQMVSQINDEVNDRERIVAADGQNYAHAAIRDGQQAVDDVRQEAQRYTEFLRANPIAYYYGGRYRRYRVRQRSQEIAAVRAQAEAEQIAIMRQAQSGAAAAMNLAAQRRLSLEESATNLERQFIQPSLSGVRLNPEGTNLYVRNFVPSETNQGDSGNPGGSGDNLPQQLVATPKRLTPPGGQTGGAPGGAGRALSGARAKAGHGSLGGGKPWMGQPSAGVGLINTATRDTSTGVYGKVMKP